MAIGQSELKGIAESCAEKVASAKDGLEYFNEPFRHVVIDDFLPESLANACLDNFPDVLDQGWEHANDADIEVKYRTTWKSEFDIPEGISEVVRILNSSLFLQAMSKRIGIEKIMPDPYFTGGGLNMTMRWGLLDVHVDGNYHDASGLNRRLNALIYLNPGWQEDWGGEFGVYDKSWRNCLKKVPPLFNRLVIFDSHDYSYHGLPEPISFPEWVPRKSILLYYYTKEARPGEQIAIKDPHSAIWVKRDFKDKRWNQTRDFY